MWTKLLLKCRHYHKHCRFFSMFQKCLMQTVNLYRIFVTISFTWMVVTRCVLFINGNGYETLYKHALICLKKLNSLKCSFMLKNSLNYDIFSTFDHLIQNNPCPRYNARKFYLIYRNSTCPKTFFPLTVNFEFWILTVSVKNTSIPK